MIIFEDVISEIVSQIPPLDGFKPNFHGGNRDELNRYLKLKEQPYPLVWLIPGRETHSLRGREKMTMECRFILATRELNQDQLNDYRFRNSFDKVLIPLFERFVEGVKKSNRTLFSKQDIQIWKRPNYSEADKHKTIDLWDAIQIDCTIQVNDNCQNEIKWLKK